MGSDKPLDDVEKVACVISNKPQGDASLDAFTADLDKLAEAAVDGMSKQAIWGEIGPTAVGTYLTALPFLVGAPALAAYHMAKGNNPHEEAIKRIKNKLEQERAPEVSMRMVPVDEKNRPIPPNKTHLYEPAAKTAQATSTRSRSDELAEKFLIDVGLVSAV